jgi:hypothetical protein
VAKKKKSRVPAPPRPAQARERRVQAPQRRVEHRHGSRSRLGFIVLGVAILLVAVGVGVAMAFRGGGDGEAASGSLGPCTFQTFSPMGRQHVNKLSAGFQYNSFPPTSGPHYPPGPKAPAVWNIYDSSVDEIALVHNLEHGGIVVQYGSKVPQETVAQIAQWYQASPLGMVVAPLPPLSDLHAKPSTGAESKVFLTAWTHLATCTGFDESAFTKFRDSYRGPGGDAPEKFPLEALQPGGQ